MVTEVCNHSGSATQSKYEYQYDELGRRTEVVRTGEAFDIQPPNEGFIDLWGYNDRSELTTTDRHEWTASGGPGARLNLYGDYDYEYDNIGNRESYRLDTDPATTYTANDLNQYTETDDPDEDFTYDDDGNLSDDGTYEYTWNAENRLIRVAPASTPVDGDKKLEFKYDYMGRRVRKTASTHNGSTWVEDSDLLFVYDGWNVVLVLDDDNDTQRKYTWGLDLSRTLHGAGGIGGLLAVVETQGTVNTSDDEHYWYFYDANGNVGQVLDATDINDLKRAAHYEYDPYGNLVVIDNDVYDVSTGELEQADAGYANANPYRFSTKWLDTELAASGVNGAVGDTGLYYYGYRYYSPTLGRWLNRDSVNESGAVLVRKKIDPETSFISRDGARKAEQHLYAFVQNRPVYIVDRLGLICGIMVYRVDMAKDKNDIDVGHEWIEYPGGSMGFWPEGDDLWDAPGEVKMPDPYQGSRSGPSWFTKRRKGNWLSGLLGGGEPHLFQSDTSCACATCPQIARCLIQYARAWGSHRRFDLGTSNCRDFVRATLRACCLKKEKDKRAK